MAGYIGQINVGGTDYKIGSTLFAIFDSENGQGSVTTGTTNNIRIFNVPFGSFPLASGVTIHVQFKQAWAGSSGVDTIQLKVGDADPKTIENPNGATTWSAGSVISFTYDGAKWVMNSTQIDTSNITINMDQLSNFALGNITNEGKLQTTDVVIASGDKLIITDASDENKVARSSLAFGGSADGTYLNNVGQWATPPDTKYDLIVGASSSATDNAAVAANTNSIFLNLFKEGGSVTTKGSHNIVGDSVIKVSSDNSGNITIATATAYGDEKNPYGSKTKNYVLAAPSNAAGAPTFRAIVAADLPEASTTAKGIVQLSAAADSTTLAATAKSVYDLGVTVNGLLASSDALVYQGVIAGAQASTNGGAYTPAANKGDVYKVSSSGYVNGVYVEAGDMFICNTDSTAAANSSTYATVQESWDIIQTNLISAVTSYNGEAGYLAKFKSANSIEKGPQISSNGTGFLKEDGTWATPEGTYTLPLAANGTRGGIQIGYSQNGTNYPVLLSSEKAYVSVPWTDVNVTQAYSTTNNNYPLLFSATAGTSETSSRGATTTILNNNIYANPSDGSLHASKLYGTFYGTLNSSVLGTDDTVTTALTFYHKSGSWKTLSINNTTTTVASVSQQGVLTLVSSVKENATLAMS